MLDSILNISNTTTTLTWQNFLICTLGSIVMGIVIAFIHMYKNRYSKNFIVTLALLPAIVQMVIMIVNGNLGTGVAVMGAFSLVRFRSLPGNSREIGSIFLAMAVGLSSGMGYLGVSFLFIIIVGSVMILFNTIPFGNGANCEKELKISIPENLDYTGIFDDLFQEYTSRSTLLRVRTTNMGSLFELQYHVLLKSEENEKKFIDALRCRNGNLTIVCGRVPENREEL